MKKFNFYQLKCPHISANKQKKKTAYVYASSITAYVVTVPSHL